MHTELHYITEKLSHDGSGSWVMGYWVRLIIIVYTFYHGNSNRKIHMNFVTVIHNLTQHLVSVMVDIFNILKGKDCKLDNVKNYQFLKV